MKKAGVVKMQLEAYKRQVQDLRLKSTDETHRADKAEFEAKRHQERAAVLASDKEAWQLHLLTSTFAELESTSTYDFS